MGLRGGERLRMLGMRTITIPAGVPAAERALGESRGSCSEEPGPAQAVRLSSTSGLPAGSPPTPGKAPTEGMGPPQMVPSPPLSSSHREAERQIPALGNQAPLPSQSHSLPWKVQFSCRDEVSSYSLASHISRVKMCEQDIWG